MVGQQLPQINKKYYNILQYPMWLFHVPSAKNLNTSGVRKPDALTRRKPLHGWLSNFALNNTGTHLHRTGPALRWAPALWLQCCAVQGGGGWRMQWPPCLTGLSSASCAARRRTRTRSSHRPLPLASRESRSRAGRYFYLNLGTVRITSIVVFTHTLQIWKNSKYIYI